MAPPELDRDQLALRTQQVVGIIGQSQRSIAKAIGVSHAFVGLVANGRSLPSVQMIVGLHEVYGVSFEWYLLGRGDPFAKPQINDSPSADIYGLLLPLVLSLGPQAEARVRGFLEGILEAVDLSNHQRSQAG